MKVVLFRLHKRCKVCNVKTFKKAYAKKLYYGAMTHFNIPYVMPSKTVSKFE